MIFVSFPYLSKISIYLFFPKGKVLCIFACWKPRRASCAPPAPRREPCSSLGARGNLPFREGGTLTLSSNYCSTL